MSLFLENDITFGAALRIVYFLANMINAWTWNFSGKKFSVFTSYFLSV